MHQVKITNEALLISLWYKKAHVHVQMYDKQHKNLTIYN